MEERLKDTVRPWTDEMRKYDKMRKLLLVKKRLNNHTAVSMWVAGLCN